MATACNTRTGPVIISAGETPYAYLLSPPFQPHRVAQRSVDDQVRCCNHTNTNTNNNNPHSATFNCSWILETTPNTSLLIRFVDFELDHRLFNRLLITERHSLGQKQIIAQQEYRGRRVAFPPYYSHPTSELWLEYSGTLAAAYTSQFVLYFEQAPPLVEDCQQGEVRCRNRLRCYRHQQRCDDVDDCGDGTDEEGCSQANLTFARPCGHKGTAHVRERIVGGHVSAPGEWPWIVSMRLPSDEPKGHKCGGTIINRKWIVTAAHCFREASNISDWQIHAGKYYKYIKDATESVRYIERLWIHPEYRGFEPESKNLSWYDRESNDIALIELNAPLPNDNGAIGSLCVDDAVAKVGERVTVAGWGETYDTGGEFVVKHVSVPIISNEQCSRWMEHTIGERMLCAGVAEGGQDSCYVCAPPAAARLGSTFLGTHSKCFFRSFYPSRATRAVVCLVWPATRQQLGKHNLW